MMISGTWLNDQRKIGLGLTACGFLFTFLGMLLMFDRGLLAMGNLLFLAGMTMTIGVQSTLTFFGRKANRKGSAFYLGGAALVIVGWTIIGVCLEAYGFWLLFCEFFPTILRASRSLPVINRLFDMPLLKTVFNKLAPLGGLPQTIGDIDMSKR